MEKKEVITLGEFSAEVIRSSRKSMALEMRSDGMLLIRCNRRTTKRELQEMLIGHQKWIREKRAIIEQQKRTYERQGNDTRPLTMEEIRALADQAIKVLPQKTGIYAKKLGVTYGRITVRNQKTRWGSCSSKGNLNFNCLLMLTPDYVQDYVVVHELCHRLEMNHSERFWALVAAAYPQWIQAKEWLNANGRFLMRRMTGE